VRFFKTARVALTVLCLLPGCSVVAPQKFNRGNAIDQDAMKQLVPGVTSRADVTALIGSPTAHATFDDNTWIYVSQVTETRVGRTEGVDSQKVVVLAFTPNGVLKDVRQFNDDDSIAVAMVSRSTPSPGSEASFLQQLLGNVGRFSPTGGGMGGGSTGNTLP